MESMNRRDFLLRGSLAYAGCSSLLGFSGRAWAQIDDQSCGVQQNRPYAVSDVSFESPGRNLRPVHIKQDDVMRTIVGLRPYRPSGFVVRAEKIDDTLVIHNYGHGGAGITLSWGTSQLALAIGCPEHTGPAAVLGCGAVGLATARLLQQAGVKTTIYTKALPPDTTSYIAGGQWLPFLVADPNKSDARFNQQLVSAAEFSYERFVAMTGDRFGIRWLRSYSISKNGFNETGPTGLQGQFRSMMPEFRDLTADEHPFPALYSVRQYDSLLIEPPRYLPAMMDAFREASGTVVIRGIADRADLAQLPEKLVFNCTGMGAKDIFPDDELTPVRGQLTILKPQPEVSYGVAHDELYMIPRTDGILLGGTYELGMTSLMPDMDKKRKILARHKAFFDSYRRSG